MKSSERYNFTILSTGIYTTTANNDTLDEAPEAYKDKDDIIRLIEPTAKVLFFMKPKMNIKAAEGSPKWAKSV